MKSRGMDDVARMLAGFDVPGLEEWIGAHDPTSDGDASLALAAARLWLRLLQGRAQGTEEAAGALRERAARAASAPLVIEATALSALAALASGDLPRALGLARRASRMARTEALPEQEWLANVVLARVRRYSGRGHLAVRIESSLARLASPRWHAWLCWELTLAGGQQAATALAAQLAEGQGRAADAALALRALAAAARSGDRAVFEAQAARIAAALRPCALFADELDCVLRALDPGRAAPAALAAWCRGETALPAGGLHGLAVDSATIAAADAVFAYVATDVEARGARVLRSALATGAAVPYESGQARALTGLAVLGLAGPDGLERDEFFRAVYGFPYQVEIHRGVFETLIYRMRKVLVDRGEIARDGDRIALRAAAPLLIPDPRCAYAPEERVARFLADAGPTTAEAVARSLGLPIRTVQALLKELVADNACLVLREGRTLRYRVEDTTFTEPTPLAS